MTIIDEFFFDTNRVEGITEADYQRAQPYIEAAQAFAQSTYQSIYIIDYFRKNFLYVSDNPLFLCGHTADEVRQMGYGFYINNVPADEQPMLTEPMATLCATEDLNFTSVSGLEAYIGSGFNRTTGVLLMTRVYDVPAGTGLVLKGNPGTYEIPYSPSPSVYVNLLEGVTSSATIGQTEGGYTNYILANGTNGTGFYLVSGTGQLAAGKAYLRIPSASAARIATIALDFDEGTTGIYSVESQNEEEYYSVSGQRIEGTPQKSGIYVKNGRKVIIK